MGKREEARAGEGLVYRPSYESASCYGRMFGMCFNPGTALGTEL